MNLEQPNCLCSRCGNREFVIYNASAGLPPPACTNCGATAWSALPPEPPALPPRRADYDYDRPRGVSRDAQHIGDLLAQQSLSSDGIAGWLRVQSVNRPKTAGNFVIVATVIIAVLTLLLAAAGGGGGAIILGVIFWFAFLFVRRET